MTGPDVGRGRSIGPLLVASVGTTLAAFRVPGYSAFWLASASSGVGWAASLVAIGWIALQVSNSSFAVGLTLAARLAPALVLGIPFGALADRVDRRVTLVVVNAIASAGLVGLAALAWSGRLGLAEMLVASALLGIVDTMRGTAGQTYAFDLAGPSGSTNAIALSNLGAMLFGAAGGIAGGIVLDHVGAPATFLVAASSAAIAGSILLIAGRRRPVGNPARHLALDARTSLTLLVRNRLVALIALVVILGEVLGFSSLTVYPAFARDVLGVDAAGLGAMSAARSVGGVCGSLVLAGAGIRDRGGLLLVMMTTLFGLGLVAFAATTSFVVSLGLLVVIGVAASALDTLGQALLQRNVDDGERGAAMGIWFFAIGFGPIGHLAMGAGAATAGAPLALGISGATLVVAMVGVTFFTTTRTIR
jgi:MFS family permease